MECHEEGCCCTRTQVLPQVRYYYLPHTYIQSVFILS
ncbi:hemoglobin-2-like [Iris pallida]|uniref:Hemoglobin-2-like n=1 Tax=Iris pallida TaxID=29817 RepID=A0AAX6F7S6_IRIPA|nr:hemoglobin-2-like [Iris pallida]KAJ6849186.1 hemoglobin-2-like [Iris pallida]